MVSILRLTALQTFADSENFSWDSCENILLSGLELGLGVMCACMPTGFAALIQFLALFKAVEPSHNTFDRPSKQGSKTLSHQMTDPTDRRWALLESALSEGGDEISLAEISITTVARSEGLASADTAWADIHGRTPATHSKPKSRNGLPGSRRAK